MVIEQVSLTPCDSNVEFLPFYIISVHFKQIPYICCSFRVVSYVWSSRSVPSSLCLHVEDFFLQNTRMSFNPLSEISQWVGICSKSKDCLFFLLCLHKVHQLAFLLPSPSVPQFENSSYFPRGRSEPLSLINESFELVFHELLDDEIII